MGGAAGLTVVKLGGSQASSAHLNDWLDAVALGAGRMVVVPGGGPFAAAVRAPQPAMGFHDPPAHRMPGFCTSFTRVSSRKMRIAATVYSMTFSKRLQDNLFPCFGSYKTLA